MELLSHKVTLKICLICFFASFLLVAQGSFASALKQPSSPSYVELPIKFLSAKDPMPIVTVNDGKHQIEFFLDTGSNANLTLIQVDIKRLNAKPTGTKCNSVTNYGKYRSREYMISNWSIGGFGQKNIRCEELSSVRQSKEPYASRSTLGLGLLRRYAVLIDYAHSKLVLYANNDYQHLLDTSSWMKVASPYDPLGIVLEGNLGADKFRFCIDTGCVVYDNENKRSYNIMKGVCKKSFHQPLKTLGEMDVAESVDMQLGQETLADLNFMFLDFLTQPKTIDGFLGSDFLNKHAVLVDFKNNCLFIRKDFTRF